MGPAKSTKAARVLKIEIDDDSNDRSAGIRTKTIFNLPTVISFLRRYASSKDRSADIWTHKQSDYRNYKQF